VAAAAAVAPPPPPELAFVVGLGGTVVVRGGRGRPTLVALARATEGERDIHRLGQEILVGLSSTTNP
jgi:hypothetical protein